MPYLKHGIAYIEAPDQSCSARALGPLPSEVLPEFGFQPAYIYLRMKTLLAILTLLALVGCEHNQPRTVATQSPRYDLNISQTSKDEVHIEDVGISVRPITLDRARSMNNLFATYTYWNPRNTKEQKVGKNIMVSLPSFEVQVMNSTSNAIGFQKAAVRLVDDAGNSYQAQLKQDVVDFVEQQLNSIESRGWAVERSAASSAARSLKLFDKNYESLPGVTEKRILAFDIGNATDERAYNQFLSKAKYVRVIFFNVPVKIDQAGNVSKVAKFEFLFDVVRR